MRTGHGIAGTEWQICSLYLPWKGHILVSHVSSAVWVLTCDIKLVIAIVLLVLCIIVLHYHQQTKKSWYVAFNKLCDLWIPLALLNVTWPVVIDDFHIQHWTSSYVFATWVEKLFLKSTMDLAEFILLLLLISTAPAENSSTTVVQLFVWSPLQTSLHQTNSNSLDSVSRTHVLSPGVGSPLLLLLSKWRPCSGDRNSLALPATRVLTQTNMWFAQFAMGWLVISLTLTVGAGLGDPYGCLLTQNILWFCEYGKVSQPDQGRAGISIISTCTDDGPFPWTQQCHCLICT